MINAKHGRYGAVYSLRSIDPENISGRIWFRVRGGTSGRVPVVVMEDRTNLICNPVPNRVLVKSVKQDGHGLIK